MSAGAASTALATIDPEAARKIPTSHADWVGVEDSGHTLGKIGGFRSVTDFTFCVIPLLKALNWFGHAHHVAEALPHFADTLDLTGLRNMMANLHYRSTAVRISLDRIDRRALPCLFVPDDGPAMVVVRGDKDTLHIFDSMDEAYIDITPGGVQGTAYFFQTIANDPKAKKQQEGSWFKGVSDRFRGLVYQMFAVTFFLNVLALATPLFVMAVYDQVVGAGSLTMLAYLSIGVTIALGCDLFLRRVRTHILSFIAARIDNIVGNAVFKRIMFLPPTSTERATIGAQIARIKDFESLRDFFTSPVVLMMFELPFALFYILIIALLGGPLAFVPIALLAIYGVVGAIMMPLVRDSMRKASRARARRQEFLVEALSNLRVLKYTGAVSQWLARYRQLSAETAVTGFKVARLAAVVNTVSHGLMVASGIATLAFGVVRVIDGNMTVGALVASMILVWRALGPLQMGFLSVTRLAQAKSSVEQLDSLMKFKTERDPDVQITPINTINGKITFSRVSIRYSAEADPALAGVSFEVKPGEVVCIVGGNGSGKSTVIKLLMLLYQPQAGSVRIDNQDIRQMDPLELRHAVGYCPQSSEYFYGTIAQNLRLASPTASDLELEEATRLAGVYDDIMALPEGFRTRIGDSKAGQMPSSFQQRLNLARCYVKNAPIMLFDEPGNGLDYDDDQTFMRTVDNFRGTRTIMIVTHRPSHLRIADKVIWMENGMLRMMGPPDEVRKHLPADFL